jgi:hypothetical protein
VQPLPQSCPSASHFPEHDRNPELQAPEQLPRTHDADPFAMAGHRSPSSTWPSQSLSLPSQVSAVGVHWVQVWPSHLKQDFSSQREPSEAQVRRVVPEHVLVLGVQVRQRPALQPLPLHSFFLS